MPLIRLTPLAGDTIMPLADAKAQVRVLNNAEDDLIAMYRDAAVSHVERVSGIALAPATFRWEIDRFPAQIALPMGPVTALTGVTYSDASGAEQTYSDARLIRDVVYPAANGSWPISYDYVAVEFTAGLAAPGDAPPLVMAAKLLVAHYYNHREAVVLGPTDVNELPLGVRALIDSYVPVRV